MGEFGVLWKALSQNMMWGVTKEDIRPQPLASRPHPCTCVHTEEHVQRHILHTQREAHIKSSHIEETSKYKSWDWYYKKKMGKSSSVTNIGNDFFYKIPKYRQQKQNIQIGL